MRQKTMGQKSMDKIACGHKSMWTKIACGQKSKRTQEHADTRSCGHKGTWDVRAWDKKAETKEHGENSIALSFGWYFGLLSGFFEKSAVFESSVSKQLEKWNKVRSGRSVNCSEICGNVKSTIDRNCKITT